MIKSQPVLSLSRNIILTSTMDMVSIECRSVLFKATSGSKCRWDWCSSNGNTDGWSRVNLSCQEYHSLEGGLELTFQTGFSVVQKRPVWQSSKGRLGNVTRKDGERFINKASLLVEFNKRDGCWPALWDPALYNVVQDIQLDFSEYLTRILTHHRHGSKLSFMWRPSACLGLSRPYQGWI